MMNSESHDDSYDYNGLKAILASADKSWNFDKDIDDSEEDEISDEELRMAIKSRKAKEKARRDDLTTVKSAAMQAVKAVEEVRK